MISQHFCIPQPTPWCIDVLYDAKPQDAVFILDKLHDMGCPVEHLNHAEDLLTSGIPNQGLTYSDKSKRHTLIVVGFATDVFGMLNTVEHEVNHLESHICEYYGINMHSENAAYLSGDIKEIMARNAWRNIRKIYRYLE